MTLCAICKEREATQKHHLIYEPEEITIDVCVECHNRIHIDHGVGLGRGAKRQKALDKPKEKVEIPFEEPKFTFKVLDRATEEPHIPYILSKSTGEELTRLNCRHGCGNWILWLEESTGRMYLRCAQCGWDLELKRIG